VTEAGNCTFFTVADSRYWFGAVALVNSLRLVGHEEPVVVLDTGFSRHQRARLEAAAEVVEPPVPVRTPFLAKWLLPLARDSSVPVLLDADLVVTRALTPLLAEVERGRVVAFVDRLATRGFSEWDALAGAQVHAHPYVNSGLIGLPAELAPAILQRTREAQERVDLAAARLLGRGTAADPFHFPDQDTWNATLRALVPPERLLALEHRLAPTEPWDEVSVEDAETLRCVNPDGSRPHLVHVVGPKPWLANVAATAYEQLLPRLVLSDDVVIPLRRRDLPPRLRWARFVGREAVPRRVARAIGLRRLVQGTHLGSTR
jgi:hypothetical protein